MKLLGFALIAAGLLAAASTEAAAGRRIAGPYYVSYPSLHHAPLGPLV